MSNFSYDDFAVLVRKFNPEMLSPESLKSLRIVPLSTAPSMADAIKGTNLAGLDSESNLPREKNGHVVESNVTVQHNSDGYCRLVGHIEAVKPQEGQGVPVTTAKAFVLYRTVTDASDQSTKKEVIAVASLKEGFAIGDVCYPSFTITTVNNYQSVAFNPNAFATVEDLKNINGLDGLHIAFDTASGDLKLLDKDGNVLDQANLPIKTDVIIADGEEGYKYVKTDVKQDIHADKAWMPEGKTAWEAVGAVHYTRKHAALVVGQGSSRVFVDTKVGRSFPISTDSVTIAHVEISDSTYMVADIQEGTCNLFKIRGNSETGLYQGCKYSGEGLPIDVNGSQYTIKNGLVNVDVIKAEDGVTTCVLSGTNNPDMFQAWSLDGGYTRRYQGRIETSGGSSTGKVLGITTDDTNLYTFDEGAQPHAEITSISGGKVRWLDRKPLTAVPNHTLKYGLEAFVWTVKGAEDTISDPFFQQLNNSLLALGFHEGDDIALGTNLPTLAPAPAEGDSPLDGVDADDYMHGETKNKEGKTNKELREQEVDAQRKLAKEELAEWNKQHPALVHDGLSGTRISKGGLDVRNGKIEIGNGVANDNNNNSVKRYVIETDIGGSVGARTGKGLQISVVDSQTSSGAGEGATYSDVQKDILTINAEDYISGAPTCLALLKCHKNPNGLTADLTETSDGTEVPVNVGRITANFTASGMKDSSDGVFTLTITDNRANNGFGSAHRIVEIIPVYKSGADADEAVPAQRSISAIAKAVPDNENRTSTLSIRCSQVIDWAQSIDLGGTVGTTSDDPNATEVPSGSGNYVKPNGMELYLIVKVY